MLVGNKMDQRHLRTVLEEQPLSFAEEQSFKGKIQGDSQVLQAEASLGPEETLSRQCLCPSQWVLTLDRCQRIVPRDRLPENPAEAENNNESRQPPRPVLAVYRPRPVLVVYRLLCAATGKIDKLVKPNVTGCH